MFLKNLLTLRRLRNLLDRLDEGTDRMYEKLLGRIDKLGEHCSCVDDGVIARISQLET
jgi:hypothetical protein